MNGPKTVKANKDNDLLYRKGLEERDKKNKKNIYKEGCDINEDVDNSVTEDSGELEYFTE